VVNPLKSRHRSVLTITKIDSTTAHCQELTCGSQRHVRRTDSKAACVRRLVRASVFRPACPGVDMLFSACTRPRSHGYPRTGSGFLTSRAESKRELAGIRGR